jgi:hypothetical protein
MSKKLDQIKIVLERLWGHFAITKNRLSDERGVGFRDGFDVGHREGYRDGFKIGFAEGKIFDTSVPHGLEVIKRKEIKL